MIEFLVLLRTLARHRVSAGTRTTHAGSRNEEHSMSARKATPKATRKPPRKSAQKTGDSSAGFTAEERAAMKELVRERKAAARGEEPDEAVVLEKIAAMEEPDRTLARRVHAIVMRSAPDLAPRLWYGMPAYAKDGKVLCYFQDARKFKARYATFGFSDVARLDEGNLWPVAFAVKDLDAAAEAKLASLVKQAVS
jgi:uncharacterized protein YdhG (YjbR/CyaY superfamily)